MIYVELLGIHLGTDHPGNMEPLSSKHIPILRIYSQPLFPKLFNTLSFILVLKLSNLPDLNKTNIKWSVTNYKIMNLSIQI